MVQATKIVGKQAQSMHDGPQVMHHALVAMFGSYLVLLCLAAQHRMPSIEEVVMQVAAFFTAAVVLLYV